VTHYDRQAILYGVVCGLFFALPAAVLQRTALDDAPWSGLMLAVHGALAGAITFVGPQVVYLIATRDVPNPIAIAFGLLMFASLGTIGAYVAVWKGAAAASSERGR
jgi:hypothetical protein